MVIVLAYTKLFAQLPTCLSSTPTPSFFLYLDKFGMQRDIMTHEHIQQNYTSQVKSIRHSLDTEHSYV